MSFIPSLAAWPVRLEYMTGLMALGLFALLAIPIVWLGTRSLNGLGPVRKWVAIGTRLLVLLLFVLILGGIRWQRQHTDLEVMVLRDISESTTHFRNYPGESLERSIDDYLREAAGNKPADDKVGILSFHRSAIIDRMPNTSLALDTHAIREPGAGTDVASAIQLALASLGKDAMHRLVLIWDGNSTEGNLEEAIAQAAALKVPIDVMPLSYSVDNEVMMERVVAPSWKRENEPFSIDVILRSTNPFPVAGKLSLLHQNVPMDLDPYTEGKQTTRQVTLQPGLNRQSVRVPPLTEGGAHQFHAVFEAENVTAAIEGAAGQDSLAVNNAGDAFTFVQGKGEVLYVDNVYAGGSLGPGQLLAEALAGEGIRLRRISVDAFPNDLISLQNYDAVILANVPRGAGGLGEDQQEMLAKYVHDLGGGLIMIGGEDAFGAGGWQGSKLEEILPVNMDVPARREIPKGALVLVMHSCEMPDGNYWGTLCAIKAIETLSARDEVGIVSYGWQNGTAIWDFPLQEKGDGSKVIAAAKKMQLGDMPSFDDSMDLALNGKNGQGGLKNSTARQKHVIIISDGDPAPPNPTLLQQYKDAKVSVSTITVYGHQPNVLPHTMKYVADELKGRAYGPIENNPNQLPQIFIKEATLVRRSLIQEDTNGYRINLHPSASEIVKGFGEEIPPVFGYVLTSKKPSPQIELPWVVGKNNDPIFAHWQTGLGKAAAFTSDAHNKWATSWVGNSMYAKFWSQAVRGVSRPPMSSDFEVRTAHEGEKGMINVEAINKDAGFLNFLNIRGGIVGPDGKAQEIRLVQTGPGAYRAEFDARLPGNYAIVMNYRGPKGEAGVLPAGLAVNTSPELRQLRSNDAILQQVAERTGGRLLNPFDPSVNLFTRDGVAITASPLPVWDIVLPILLGLIIVDVAVRRIAWDWNATKKLAFATANKVREFTMTTRKVEGAPTLDALKRVRDEVAEQKFKAEEKKPATTVARPDPSRKFEARQAVEGDITQVVGGATDKPIPPPPKKIEPKGAPAAASGPGGHTGSLLEAKRRARQQMEQREKES